MTLEVVNEKVDKIKNEVDRILEILGEHELTDEAKRDLEESRATPIGKYVPHETVKKMKR